MMIGTSRGAMALQPMSNATPGSGAKLGGTNVAAATGGAVGASEATGSVAAAVGATVLGAGRPDAAGDPDGLALEQAMTSKAAIGRAARLGVLGMP
jgi:hypothetical protein